MLISVRFPENESDAACSADPKTQCYESYNECEGVFLVIFYEHGNL